jgi:NADPH-dependent F420 reductase
MKYAIIGAGNVGSAIGSAVAQLGHDVVITADSAGSAAEVAEKIGARAASSNTDAARDADVIVLAVPYAAIPQVRSEIASEADGKVVIDVVNPLKPDASGLATDGESCAEGLQADLPGARVVKAFNSVFASMQANPRSDGEQLDGFYAGDDPDAKAVVRDLLQQIGYRAIDAGPLSSARALEAMAFLNISLNMANGWPWRSAWKLIGPSGDNA